MRRQPIWTSRPTTKADLIAEREAILRRAQALERRRFGRTVVNSFGRGIGYTLGRDVVNSIWRGIFGR